MFRPLQPFLTAVLWLVGGAAAQALSIQLDYSYDSNNFFSGANVGRRTYLQAAANALSSRLSDDLLAIAPSGSNSWSGFFNNPGTGAQVSLSNPTIPADTIRVYVGARELGGSTLGIGGPGGFSGSGSQSWLNTLSARGEAGALAATKTDFGPWGGALTFDLSTNWYFDADPSSTEAFGSQSDFFSVALHELGHVLGIGTAQSWDALISAGRFNGTHAKAVYGTSVGVDSDGGHWADGISGHLEATGALQEACMDPSLFTGTRKYFTDLDFAGLADVGWQVKAIPEPGTGLLVLSAGVCLLARRRKVTCGWRSGRR